MGSDRTTILYWRELSEYDLKVARSMLEAGHYLYVGFMCHQSIEKMLKAIYVEKNSTVPPFTHGLDKLIDMAGLRNEFTEEMYDFIDELSPLNIQARYPAYKESIHRLIDRKKAEEIYKNSEGLTSWLRARLK